MNQKVTMGNLLEVEQINAVEAVESTVFEIRLLLQGAHTIASHRCPHSGVELHNALVLPR